MYEITSSSGAITRVEADSFDIGDREWLSLEKDGDTVAILRDWARVVRVED